MKSRMQHQGGWAATFVVVAIVLALGLAGGIYYLRSNMNQDVATTDTNPQNEKSLDETTGDKKEQTKPESSDEQVETPPEDAAPSETTKPESKPEKVDTATPEPSAEQSELPETGPSDVFVQLFAITSLTISSVAYLRSR